MGKYSYDKGRRKDVEKFTIWHGLWMLAIVGAILAVMLLLYVLGYLPIDTD